MLPEDDENIVRFEDYHNKAKPRGDNATVSGAISDDWGIGPSGGSGLKLRQGADDWDDSGGGGGFSGLNLGGDDDGSLPADPGYPVRSPEERRQHAARCLGCCSIICVILLAGGIIGGLEYKKYRESRADPFINHYADQGYEIRRGDTLALTEPPKAKILLVGTHVTIEASTGEDLAVRAKVCDVTGTLTGKLLVRGEVLNIGEKADVADLEVDVQRINRAGKIRKMTGTYKALVEP